MSTVKLPKIDLAELDLIQKQNKKERLAFLEFYAEWLKKKTSKIRPSPV